MAKAYIIDTMHQEFFLGAFLDCWCILKFFGAFKLREPRSWDIFDIPLVIIRSTFYAEAISAIIFDVEWFATSRAITQFSWRFYPI